MVSTRGARSSINRHAERRSVMFTLSSSEREHGRAENVVCFEEKVVDWLRKATYQELFSILLWNATFETFNKRLTLTNKRPTTSIKSSIRRRFAAKFTRLEETNCGQRTDKQESTNNDTVVTFVELLKGSSRRNFQSSFLSTVSEQQFVSASNKMLRFQQASLNSPQSGKKNWSSPSDRGAFSFHVFGRKNHNWS